MKLSSIMSHSKSSESRTVRKHTPWIASPLRSRDEELISRHGEHEHSMSNAEDSVLEHDGRRLHRHDSDIRIFKETHESNVAELFYDLFFVADLTIFTANNHIVDGKCRQIPHSVDWFAKYHSTQKLHWVLHNPLVYLAPDLTVRCPFFYRLCIQSSLQIYFLLRDDWIRRLWHPI